MEKINNIKLSGQVMVETPPSAEIIKGPWKQTANTPSKIEN